MEGEAEGAGARSITRPISQWGDLLEAWEVRWESTSALAPCMSWAAFRCGVRTAP